MLEEMMVNTCKHTFMLSGPFIKSSKQHLAVHRLTGNLKSP